MEELPSVSAVTGSPQAATSEREYIVADVKVGRLAGNPAVSSSTDGCESNGTSGVHPDGPLLSKRKRLFASDSDAGIPSPAVADVTAAPAYVRAKEVAPSDVEANPAAWDPDQSLASIRHEFGEHGGVNMSIENSATFTVMQPETMAQIFSGEIGPEDDAFVYSRHFNPTVMHLGRQLAALEGTEAGYCTASGMAAISAAVLQLCSSGDNIVASNRLYGGSFALLSQFLPKKCAITTTFVDITDLAQVEQAIVASPATKLLFFESISNPTLVVADIPRLAALAHRHGVQVVVDNTFAPVIVSPARLGADVVVHSLSKFISGGSDIIAGSVCGSKKFIMGMMDLMEGPFMIMGATMNPQVAFQISTRLPHLSLRMKAHSERALAVALELQAAGIKAVYPGLPSHPQHALLRSMVNPGYGFGGMLCADLGSSKAAYDFMRILQNDYVFGYMAVSLGYHDTLMSCSGASTSSEMGSEQRAAVGISAGLVRISVGFSGSLEQRLGQLKGALKSLQNGLNDQNSPENSTLLDSAFGG